MRALPLLVVVIVAGCSAPAGPTMPASASRIDSLRYRLGGHPHDVDAHLELARLLAASAQPGGALRHYQAVARNHSLATGDRATLSDLLLQRAGERVLLRDGGAIDDIDRARAMSKRIQVGGSLEREAVALAALAALRREDQPAARRWLARLAALAPGDARLAAGDSDRASVNALGQAAWWAWHGGARRAALQMLEQYWKRGGRDAQIAELFARARYWWGGAASMDLLDRQAIAATGASLCAVAVSPDERGCVGSLPALLEDPATAHAIDRQAAKHHWRVRDPAQAAAWVRFALREHATGHGQSWIDALSRRVVPAELTGPAPAFAAPTLRRLAGDRGAAARALDTAVAAAATLTPGQRSVLVAEAAAQHRSEAAIDRLLAMHVSTEGWVVALLDARARGDRALRPALAAAPEAARLRVLRATGDLDAVASRHGADAADRARAAHLSRMVARLGRREAQPSGAIDAALARPFFADPALARIAADFMHDPARADRTARVWADGAAAAGSRGPALAELFDRLGDPARALAWRDEVAASSPHNPDYRLALAIAAARAGDPDRAMVELTLAAAGSGNPGPAFVAAGRALLDAGALPQALDAARSAVGLLSREEQLPALELARAATEQLHRPSETERLVRAYRQRLAPDARGPLVTARDAAIAGDDAAAALFPDDAEVAAAYARRLAGAGKVNRAVAVAAEASARDPWSPAGPAAVLALAGADDPRFAAAARRLLALGMVARDSEDQRAALGALAAAFGHTGSGAGDQPISASAGASGR